jgi:hypothetical protein
MTLDDLAYMVQHGDITMEEFLKHYLVKSQNNNEEPDHNIKEEED